MAFRRASATVRRPDGRAGRWIPPSRRGCRTRAGASPSPARRPPVAASTKWRDVQNWRQLRLGMTMDQVRALLGEPERVDATPSHHTGAGIIRSALRSTSTAVPERLPVGRNLNDGEYPTFTDALGEVSRRAQPAALGHDRVATAALCGSSRLRAPPLRRADLRRTIPQTPTPSATTSLHRA
jgi:hypothetical protein